jgi:hypothetical protein
VPALTRAVALTLSLFFAIPIVLRGDSRLPTPE